MDSEEDTDALERQIKDMTQQEVEQLLEAITLRAIDATNKLSLRAELQDKRSAETLYRQIAEGLNRQAIELNQRTAELNSRESELIRRAEQIAYQSAEINPHPRESNDREGKFQMMDSSIVKVIADAGAGDYQKIAASQIELVERYYKKVLQQANYSFWWALFAAIVGLFFFLVASGLILQRSGTIASASLISGVVVEVISGIGFTLYAHASRQLASFHVRLDRTLLFLFANTVCEHIKGELKETTRSELVLAMANSLKLEVKEKTRKGVRKIAPNTKLGVT
jgi:hypothetical protein